MAKMKTKRSKGRKTEPATWGITAAVMVVACVVGSFLPHRAIVLLSGALCALSVFAVVVAIKGKEAENSRLVSWGVSFGVIGGLVSFMGLSSTVSAYSFYKEPFIPFWEICLALGLAVSIFVTVKWVWKGTGWGGRIGGVILCMALVFFLCWIPLCHLNYLLDFEPPAEKQAVIEEKDVVRHRKSPDSYEFELTVDGESFDLEVDWAEYQRYEVGDTYTFRAYKGAFGKPFYMAED